MLSCTQKAPESRPPGFAKKPGGLKFHVCRAFLCSPKQAMQHANTNRHDTTRTPAPVLGPIKDPARNGITLRRKVSGCRQAQPVRPGGTNFMVKYGLKNYSAPVSAEPEGKDLFDKKSYFLDLKKNKTTPKFLWDLPLTPLDLPELAQNIRGPTRTDPKSTPKLAWPSVL